MSNTPSIREIASYHTAMLYQEVVSEVIKMLTVDHSDSSRCPCHLYAARAKSLLETAQDIANVTMDKI